MARVSESYNYESYGKGFNLMPEGVFEFGIISAQQTFTKKSGIPQWELVLQPTDSQYQTESGYKVWLFEDGCVEAIFDAMGMNPATVNPNKEYEPHSTIGGKVKAEVYHETSEYEGKENTFANIKRLYPAFNMNQTPAPQSAPSGQPAPQAPAGGFGGATAPAQGGNGNMFG